MRKHGVMATMNVHMVVMNSQGVKPVCAPLFTVVRSLQIYYWIIDKLYVLAMDISLHLHPHQNSTSSIQMLLILIFPDENYLIL